MKVGIICICYYFSKHVSFKRDVIVKGTVEYALEGLLFSKAEY